MSGVPLYSSPQHKWIAEAAGGDPEREQALLTRWKAGEPLQYVLGRWGFMNLDLAVDRRALIPRPETEILVEVALRLSPVPQRVLDLGTGSGAIVLVVAAACPDAEVWTVDASADALALARANDTAGVLKLLEGEWYSPLSPELAGGFDLIVSNPPYVSEAEFDDLDAVVREWEPKAALVSGPSGLECLQQVIEGAPQWLAPGGVVALECAPHQAEEVVALCERFGFEEARVHDDLAERARVVSANTRP